MSGAMGGSASEEFLAPFDVGEDTFVRTASGDYAANVEAVVVPVPGRVPYDDAPPAVVHDTPDTPTIPTLVDHMNSRPELRRADRPWTAADTLKNVVVKLRYPDGTVEPLAIGIPGDRDVDMKRLEAQVSPAVPSRSPRPTSPGYPALAKGYIGPGALGAASVTGIRFLVDPRVVTAPGGSPGPTSPAVTSSGSSPDVTSRPTASSRRPRCWPATPARSAGSRWRSPAASRSATSSSSAAGTPTPSV